MRTQRKENYYYVFWTVAMIAFIVPQVFTAYAYMNIKSLLEKVNSTNKELAFERRDFTTSQEGIDDLLSQLLD